MKKVLLATLAAAAFVATSADAGVRVRPYVSAKAGYGWTNQRGYSWNADDAATKVKVAGVDQTWVGAVAAGVKVCAFRAELEFNHWTDAKDVRAITTEDGVVKTETTVQQRSFMLNGYFDIPTKTAFRPYVGAGVGLARVRGKLNRREPVNERDIRRKRNIAWQVGAGFGYNLTKNVTLDVGYRYVNNGNVTIHTDPETPVKYHPRTQEVLVGLRYTF